jgi:hypothetical protein
MNKLSKKEKKGVVVSILWFLVVCSFALYEQASRSVRYQDSYEFIMRMFVFNLPLVIGWGIWWIKRD